MDYKLSPPVYKVKWEQYDHSEIDMSLQGQTFSLGHQEDKPLHVGRMSPSDNVIYPTQSSTFRPYFSSYHTKEK